MTEDYDETAGWAVMYLQADDGDRKRLSGPMSEYVANEYLKTLSRNGKVCWLVELTVRRSRVDQ